MYVQIYAEFIKSVRFMFRNRILFVMALLPPIALSIIFIQAFNPTGEGFPLAIVNDDDDNVNNWTTKFIKILESHEGTIPYFNAIETDNESAITLFNQRQTFAILYIPSTFSKDISEGNVSVLMTAQINTIHEDISKNLRLGLEGRLYLFIQKYQLEETVRPGITIDPRLVYGQELRRIDYMVSGILVMAIMWFNLLIGGVLGTTEKDYNTWTEIIMADKGEKFSRVGKILATTVISFIMILLITILATLLYGSYFTDLFEILVFSGIFVCFSLTFSILGVSYGMITGDLRAVPAPTIIVTLTFWMVGGAINPLEFSAGSELFKLLPSAAAIRILTAIIFERGVQYLFESWIILLSWTVLSIFILGIFLVKKG